MHLAELLRPRARWTTEWSVKMWASPPVAEQPRAAASAGIPSRTRRSSDERHHQALVSKSPSLEGPTAPLPQLRRRHGAETQRAAWRRDVGRGRKSGQPAHPAAQTRPNPPRTAALCSAVHNASSRQYAGLLCRDEYRRASLHPREVAGSKPAAPIPGGPASAAVTATSPTSPSAGGRCGWRPDLPCAWAPRAPRGPLPAGSGSDHGLLSLRTHARAGR